MPRAITAAAPTFTLNLAQEILVLDAAKAEQMGGWLDVTDSDPVTVVNPLEQMGIVYANPRGRNVATTVRLTVVGKLVVASLRA
jgi:hypothetical protein